MTSEQEAPDEWLRGRPLRNLTCPYCGLILTTKSRTKEHVIGRRFVPVGTLNNNWNLILWACGPCNRMKADLEDDISAISMHFHTTGAPLMSDPRLQAEARRRGAKSGSRKTGAAVNKSHSVVRVKALVGSVGTLEGAFEAPPQFEDARVYELARMQMIAFFYFLTFDRKENIGHFWRGGFFPVHGTIKSDWGNPTHRVFMATTEHWDYRLVLETAEGYFRAAIRKHPTLECWSWGLEWNDCYRLVGFFGDQSAATTVARDLPAIPVQSIIESPERWLRIRVEQPLDDSDDLLFRQPGMDVDSPDQTDQ